MHLPLAPQSGSEQQKPSTQVPPQHLRLVPHSPSVEQSVQVPSRHRPEVHCAESQHWARVQEPAQQRQPEGH